jgi:hypothetical protein
MSTVDPIASNPFHIARAYMVQAPAAARPVVRDTDPVGSIRPQPQAGGAEAVSRISAGVVPGGVNFAGGDAMRAAPSLAMYRHPADKNAAATAVNAGRMIDIQG